MPFNLGAPASRPWLALAVLALPTLLVSMDMTILYLAAPSLSASLRPSAAQLLWISDSYAFAVGCVLIPMGALGDRIGRRKLLLCGSLGFGLASALAAFSTSPAILIVARVLMGIAGATLLPSTLAMIRNLFIEPRQRSLAIGIWTTCFTLGGILGPLVGGLVLTHYWWGAVFLIGVPVMLALLLLGPLLLPEFCDPSAQRIDAPSVLLAVVAVLAVTFAIKHSAAHAVTFASAGAAVLGLVVGNAFLRRQRRLAHPLIDLDLFADRTFTAAIGANTLALFAWVGASLLVAQHLQGVLGMTPLRAGIWLAAPAIACAAGCLGAPLWARRASPAHAMGGGLLLTGIGLAALSAAAAHFGLVAIVTGMMVLGFGVSTIVTLGTDIVLGSAPAEKAGAAAALSETGADIGGAFGVAVLGSIGAAVYRTKLVLPPGGDSPSETAASDTLGAAADLASRLPPTVGADLLASAQEAFTAGLHWATAAASVVLLAMTVAFAWNAWRPSPLRRDGHGANRGTQMSKNADEAAVRSLIEEWRQAACRGDMPGVLAHRTEDIVMFDVPEPVQAKGLDAYRATWQLFFDENPVGPTRFTITEMHVIADARVAFAHALLTVGGSAACRLTLGLRKDGSQWLVTHEHHSMPVRVE